MLLTLVIRGSIFVVIDGGIGSALVNVRKADFEVVRIEIEPEVAEQGNRHFLQSNCPVIFFRNYSIARKSGTSIGVPPFAMDCSDTKPGTVKSIAV